MANDKLETQFGVSVTADFQDGTWTFEMPDGFKITAGEFAIVPKKKYDELMAPWKGLQTKEQ